MEASTIGLTQTVEVPTDGHYPTEGRLQSSKSHLMLPIEFIASLQVLSPGRPGISPQHNGHQLARTRPYQIRPICPMTWSDSAPVFTAVGELATYAAASCRTASAGRCKSGICPYPPEVAVVASTTLQPSIRHSDTSAKIVCYPAVSPVQTPSASGATGEAHVEAYASPTLTQLGSYT
ncbi:hypothetical protein CABS01_09977 [Colletotrichum abscissum]|uniref:uncharacterized protein n=1 Tax=Colletotrichum abscissum TaxID=1671311 RepID=UPI0027D5F95A|nr:uncharacterized protein CABS01_09977 [Colletotrichum abscissum]KAK1500253.1 hypothetical protein CABS01_09977 [Colletotrichum abscissum]